MVCEYYISIGILNKEKKENEKEKKENEKEKKEKKKDNPYKLK